MVRGHVPTFVTYMKGKSMHHRRSPLRYLITIVSFLLIGLASSEPIISTSEAAVGGCRSDPIVILSDGTILDVSADIGTDVSNVREIHYVVHGPRGVKLVSVIS